MSALRRKKLFCLPGLGGHGSVFNHYADLLPEYDLKVFQLVNRRKAFDEVRAMLLASEEPVDLFCNCYSAQMAIQLSEEMPDKVGKLIFLEPFFCEFQPWLKIFLPLTILVLWITRISAAIGIRRRRFTYDPDYVALSKYPIYVQPLFDMRWQNLPDYFDKCYDILTYKLPQQVNAPTLILFSPNGFSKSSKTKGKLKKVFRNARMVEMKSGTHNVLTMGAEPVVAVMRGYLNSNS